MTRTIAKNTLSFTCSKSMKFIRTPVDIWESIKEEFHPTLDACASDKNHLLKKYYTAENSCLDKDWTGEVVYCHPMFDMHISPIKTWWTKQIAGGKITERLWCVQLPQSILSIKRIGGRYN